MLEIIVEATHEGPLIYF
jgi:hypothetical protein